MTVFRLVKSHINQGTTRLDLAYSRLVIFDIAIVVNDRRLFPSPVKNLVHPKNVDKDFPSAFLSFSLFEAEFA